MNRAPHRGLLDSIYNLKLTKNGPGSLFKAPEPISLTYKSRTDDSGWNNSGD